MIRDSQSPDARWRTALGQLELQLPRETFNTWLKNATLLAYEDHQFIIGVENTYARDWLENRLKKTISRTLSAICDHNVELRFAVKPQKSEELIHQSSMRELRENAPLLAEIKKKEQISTQSGFDSVSPSETGLNPFYAFEMLVMGHFNRIAYAAGRAISESGSKHFNPLYIHSSYGLGKTHLLHAVGHSCLKKGLSVRYVTAECFTNDLIGALQGKKTDQFREKYRSLDILLVDDIDFLAGKKSTQEEFYHTIDALLTTNAQIVVAAHQPPSEIAGLDSRLTSRFEGGLVVELIEPDLISRLNILAARVKQRGLEDKISDKTLELIAHKVSGSIRELEGALNRVIATATLASSSPIIDEVDTLINSVSTRKHAISIQDIIQVVSGHYSVSAEDIIGRGRTREVSSARQIVMYLAREEADLSLKEIGDALDGRNHSTVLYSIDKVQDLIDTDGHLKRQIRSLREVLVSSATMRTPETRTPFPLDNESEPQTSSLNIKS